MARRYLETHPWITFELRLGELEPMTWLLLGEVISKCDHVAGVPLQPAVAAELNQVYLSKGAHATTQIEGNTLSEEEVLRRVRHELELPPSQQYLGQEIDNVVEACNLIVADVGAGRRLEITPERIAHFNELVLEDLPVDEGVTAGRARDDSVLVGTSYGGAPAADCEYLLERLCAKLRAWRDGAPDDWSRAVAVLSAVVAHLYIAWIHPFGDGNGRTARLIELQLLVEAGVPTVAAHLPSNFYNRTRTEYYRQLRQSSRPPYQINDFIRYALNGYVDELREQIAVIREQQMMVTWVNFVHDQFRERHTQSAARQRHLALDLPPHEPTPVSRVPVLTPRLAAAYAGKTRKTITRDVNQLERLGLIERGPRGITPRTEEIRAFLPLRVVNRDRSP